MSFNNNNIPDLSGSSLNEPSSALDSFLLDGFGKGPKPHKQGGEERKDESEKDREEEDVKAKEEAKTKTEKEKGKEKALKTTAKPESTKTDSQATKGSGNTDTDIKNLDINKSSDNTSTSTTRTVSTGSDNASTGTANIVSAGSDNAGTDTASTVAISSDNTSTNAINVDATSIGITTTDVTRTIFTGNSARHNVDRLSTDTAIELAGVPSENFLLAQLSTPKNGAPPADLQAAVLKSVKQEIPNAPSEVQQAYAAKLSGQNPDATMEAKINSYREFNGKDQLSTSKDPKVQQVAKQFNEWGQQLAEIRSLLASGIQPEPKSIPVIPWGADLVDNNSKQIKTNVLEAKIKILQTVLHDQAQAGQVVSRVNQSGRNHSAASNLTDIYNDLGKLERTRTILPLSQADQTQQLKAEASARQVRADLQSRHYFNTKDESGQPEPLAVFGNKLIEAQNNLRSSKPTEAATLLVDLKKDYPAYAPWLQSVLDNNGKVTANTLGALDNKIKTLDAIFKPANNGKAAEKTDVVNSNFLQLMQDSLSGKKLSLEQEASRQAVLSYIHYAGTFQTNKFDSKANATQLRINLTGIANGLAQTLPYNDSRYQIKPGEAVKPIDTSEISATINNIIFTPPAQPAKGEAAPLFQPPPPPAPGPTSSNEQPVSGLATRLANNAPAQQFGYRSVDVNAPQPVAKQRVPELPLSNVVPTDQLGQITSDNNNTSRLLAMLDFAAGRPVQYEAIQPQVNPMLDTGIVTDDTITLAQIDQGAPPPPPPIIPQGPSDGSLRVGQPAASNIGQSQTLEAANLPVNSNPGISRNLGNPGNPGNFAGTDYTGQQAHSRLQQQPFSGQGAVNPQAYIAAMHNQRQQLRMQYGAGKGDDLFIQKLIISNLNSTGLASNSSSPEAIISAKQAMWAQREQLARTYGRQRANDIIIHRLIISNLTNAGMFDNTNLGLTNQGTGYGNRGMGGYGGMNGYGNQGLLGYGNQGLGYGGYGNGGMAGYGNPMMGGMGMGGNSMMQMLLMQRMLQNSGRGNQGLNNNNLLALSMMNGGMGMGGMGMGGYGNPMMGGMGMGGYGNPMMGGMGMGGNPLYQMMFLGEELLLLSSLGNNSGSTGTTGASTANPVKATTTGAQTANPIATNPAQSAIAGSQIANPTATSPVKTATTGVQTTSPTTAAKASTSNLAKPAAATVAKPTTVVQPPAAVTKPAAAVAKPGTITAESVNTAKPVTNVPTQTNKPARINNGVNENNSVNPTPTHPQFNPFKDPSIAPHFNPNNNRHRNVPTPHGGGGRGGHRAESVQPYYSPDRQPLLTASAANNSAPTYASAYAPKASAGSSDFLGAGGGGSRGSGGGGLRSFVSTEATGYGFLLMGGGNFALYGLTPRGMNRNNNDDDEDENENRNSSRNRNNDDTPEMMS